MPTQAHHNSIAMGLRAAGMMLQLEQEHGPRNESRVEMLPSRPTKSCQPHMGQLTSWAEDGGKRQAWATHNVRVVPL